MKADLERYKVHYDNWFYESSLHESGYVAETVALLTERGWTYEKDGALWLKTADILREHFRKAGKKRPTSKAGSEGRCAPPGQRLLYLLCRRHRLSPQ